MKKLIINIDDVGISEAVNEAARACYEKEVITGISVMACGNAFNDAARMLHFIGKTEVGAHLTLTGSFFPVTPNPEEIKSLVNDKNTFVKGFQKLCLLYFFKKLRSYEIYLEFKNQINKIIEEGFTVTHLDSHEHIHMLPGILKLVIKLSEEFNIPYIRLPLEPGDITKKNFGFKDLMRHSALRLFTSNAKKSFKKSNIKHNDNFLGHFHAGRIDDEILDYFLENMSEGITELAVHPASGSEEFLIQYPWYKNASQELGALLDGKWKDKLNGEEQVLVTHLEI